MVISWYIMHCHFMPYHCIVTTCPGISYHFIMIHNTSLYDNITSLHFMSHLGISYQIMAFHAISWHFIPHLGISYSYHIKAFHTTSWHFTPYGISYNIIFHTTTYGMSYHITYNTYVSYIYISISCQTPSGLEPWTGINRCCGSNSPGFGGTWRLLINEMVGSISFEIVGTKALAIMIISILV